ncbi:O-antigen ligase family protein [Schinkia azotoformans]|uniref:O-antigen ligase family protein n=1 Tax=Schinkia azotoformans TaxID=1454 RepID=UPI002DBE3ABC|nr:O-antigen ligase family protein [Schinkia azotoformans]MEC1719110.1 O-antigen ligase family protein [Schinkia azotoformans]MED4413842.1 O-antigen ligase family protein [Schinkia azotoformans]
MQNPVSESGYSVLNKKNQLFKFFFVAITLTMLLISDIKFIFAIAIPQFPALNTILPVFILFFCVLLLYRKSWKIDWITLSLFMRLGFAIATMLFVSYSFYDSLKAVFVFTAAILTYYLFFNSIISKKTFSNLIAFFLLILSIQTIGSYIMNYANYSVLSKSLIQIPIGRSNYIATLALVCVIFLFFIKGKNSFQKIALLMGMATLFLTFSFGAMVSLIAVIIFSVVGQRGSKIKKVLVMFLLSLILVYLIFIYFPNYSSVSEGVISTINKNISMKITYFLDGNYERLFSDRFILYEESWNNFLSNPIFGGFNGLDFRGRSIYKPHNLFLEALSSYGILGFISLLIPLLILYIRISFSLKSYQSNVVRACSLALLGGVIHGLVEPNFFTLAFEFLWWAMAGFAMSYIGQLKKGNLKV